jgi:hypothetical protein
MTFTGAGRVRLWSGVAAGVGTILDELTAGAAGSYTSPSGDNPIKSGEQYISGIYVELVSGAMPEGCIRFTGPKG